MIDSNGPTILVVDDDSQLRAVIRKMLSRRGVSEVLEAGSVASGLETLASRRVDALLLDVHLGDGDALQVLAGLASMARRPAVIVMTADDNARAELSLHRDVDNYLLKPFSFAALDQALTELLAARGSPAEAATASELPLPEWRARYVPDLLGEHPRLLHVFRTIQSVSDTDCSVLITGDSGTGKELVARAVHAASGRAQRPFVTVNCAAMPENLVESELFGHTRGAFTGAVAPRVGRFVAADGGTLFLDEIGELPLSQQAKLLRVVQEREVVPVGDSHGRKIDVRVVAATHRDLEAMVDEGSFREDLFYRIQVVPIEMPALRDRRADIPELIEHFIRRANQRRKRSVKGVSGEAMDVLQAYDWPGNVRQVENLIERLVLLRSTGEIVLDDLPSRIVSKCAAILTQAAPLLPEDGIDLREAVERFENALILQALERTGWNKNRAASMLRMNRTTLVEKLKKKNIAEGPHAA